MRIYDQKPDMTEAVRCAVCEVAQACHYHHLHHRRYGDRGIMICFNCHRAIHDNPQWAYDNGYLIRHNNNFYVPKMKKEKKKCEHRKSFYDSERGYIKCQFCGVPTDQFSNPKRSKATTTRKSGIKMGQEKQSSDIVEAEKLKRAFAGVKIKLRNNGLSEAEKMQLISDRNAIEKTMVELQVKMGNN